MGKKSIIEWKQFQEKRATQKQIESWWKDWPDANIGIVTGKISGVMVLDIDSKEALKTVRKFLPGYKSVPRAKTGKGWHLFFKRPGKGIRNHVGLIPGLDIRADGGYVVVPPSIHESGKEYRWEVPLKKTLPIIPKQLLDFVSSAKQESKGQDQKIGRERIKQGKRNDTLTSIAGRLRRKGMDEVEIAAELFKVNKRQCDPPLAEDEVRAIAGSVMRYPEATKFENLTDVGNARRLATLYGSDLRFCHTWGKWLVWDGSRWRPDDTGEVYRKAIQTVAHIYGEAETASDQNARKNLGMHARSSESANRIEAMIRVAQNDREIAISADKLDSDPWLLNVLNGTVNLRSGKLQPHQKHDLLTKLAPVNFDPKVKCPVWNKFLDRIMDSNTTMIEFLQSAIGYSLSGDVSEQVLFFFYGTGANGKSTFLNTMQEMLGDYAKQAAPSLLLTKYGESHPTEVADLQGSRFVVAVEVEEGRRMAEVQVKQLTGGDKIKARYMRQDFFQFDPTFKLFLAANHKPVVHGMDKGMWRRIKVVPFIVTIPDADQDKRLADKLRAELSGILAWAIKGCMQWQKEDLVFPPEVKAATDDYREEMDVVATFIGDCCLLDEKGKTQAAKLYEAYAKWCEQNGEKQMNQKEFSLRLKERKYTSKRGKGGYIYWKGIVLKADNNEAWAA